MSAKHPGTGISRRRSVGLLLRNAAFTVVVPGAGGVYGPWLILSRRGGGPGPPAWEALPVVAAGVLLFLACQWVFATTGRGTPGTWDPPRRVVAVGPYRWVRNPIYVSALLIVLGEAGLFRSVELLAYAAALALAFHLLVVAYEEPRLRARFGEEYEGYLRSVRRWVPRPPRPPRAA
jgi:protein-S-isoprenylcysteine O-methyltransferase Ste14